MSTLPQRSLPNRLQWSFSRMSTFQQCRRRYYYHYYLKWDGWLPQAPPERRDTYRLSQMKSFDSLAGEIVHAQIAKVLRRFRYLRQFHTLDQCLNEAREAWDRALRDSVDGRWQLNPKRYTCLIEDYYRNPQRPQKAEAAWRRILICLTNFWNSDTWRDLQRTRREQWLALDGDPFQTVSIYGIDVHGRPDLGYDASRPGNPKSRCWVFDWKTGRERATHPHQLRFYALYAEGAWGFLPQTIKARLIYLYPEVCEEDVEITAEALVEARQMLLQSYREMCSVVSDAATNEPLGLEQFPASRVPHLCRYCQFQEICVD